MLKLIIKASSNQDSIVLDCFSGSGTTLVASEELHRKWIGIDQSEEAIRVSEDRILNLLGIFSQDFRTYKFKKDK